MLQKLSKIIKPIIVALIGVYLTNKLNIFNYISFIPKDKAFDICIASYFTILEILIEFLMETLRSKFMSELSVIISLNNTEVSIDSTPIINFNPSDLAEAIITVQITGRKRHFLNSVLMISNVGFATMQAGIHDRETSVDNNGNYIIDLEKIFGTTDMKISVSSSFRVTFVKEPIDSVRTIEIYPELKNKIHFNFHPLVTYKHNKAQMRVER